MLVQYSYCKDRGGPRDPWDLWKVGEEAVKEGFTGEVTKEPGLKGEAVWSGVAI